MNITTIIPIHEYNDEIKELLNSAIKSVRKQDGIDDDSPELIIVYSAKLDNYKEFTSLKEEKENIIFLKNEEKTDFQTQINFAVKNVKTDWFTVLELDDELSTTYYKNANKIISKLEDVDLILPILIEVNIENQALKLTNETVWSKQFVGENGEMGYLNAQALGKYTDFKISGGIFKKSTFDSVGGLKSNIVLTFTYEFLLRMLNNGAVIYTMPKIGVKHLINREGSLFDNYGKTLTIEDRKFWFDTAKKESNFYNDRVIDMSLLKKELIT